MRTLARAVGMTLFLAAATVEAQQPGGPPPGGGRPAFGMMAGVPGRGGASPIAAPADFLLAHTGDLALTDAQVVRLAAISRRSAARRKAMMARIGPLEPPPGRSPATRRVPVAPARSGRAATGRASTST
jgi:hypothetical protein